MNWAKRCIYTIVSPSALLNAVRAGATLAENKPWTTGRNLWVESRKAGLEVPIFFADARRISELLYFAILDQITVDSENRTTYRTRNARCLGGHFKTDLVVASTGARLPPTHIRPYAICVTPDWLSSIDRPRLVETPVEPDDEARTFIEALVPEPPVRTAALWRLGDAILRADEAGGEWGTTLRKDQRLLRLNIGMTEAFVLGSEGTVSVLVDPTMLPRNSRHVRDASSYPSAGGAVMMDFDADSLEDIVDFDEALRSAARKAHRKRYMLADSHEPTVLTYLERELGRPLPRPAWAQYDARDQAGAGEASGTISGAGLDGLDGEDTRTRTLRAIAERQGQGPFRDAALAAYKHKCAISSCDAEQALEAAHISAYMGSHTDRIDNTLLLRADLHTLFDQHLMAIDTTTWTVIIAPDLMRTAYREFHGVPLRLPDGEADRPRAEVLDEHRRTSKL